MKIVKTERKAKLVEENTNCVKGVKVSVATETFNRKRLFRNNLNDDVN